ncbi:MAG: tonB-system energizer ExbB [Xanthobacteraceae bacterium]|nr:tonB-system energizer ExbB [Xanthobacteraceae bacterium]
MRVALALLGIVAVVLFVAAAWAQTPAPAPSSPAPQASTTAPVASQPAAPAAQTPEPTAPAAAASETRPEISALLPRDLSPWGMFLGADIVVKIVMLGLVFASFVTWTVCVAKYWELWTAARKARQALAVLNEARSLGEAHQRLGRGTDAVAQLLRTAVQEVQQSPHPDPESLKERVSWLLERIEAASTRRIGRGMGLLATIGATGPFVGLFGTVWGIMNSFIGISNAHTTNLAVVAPGIAEALLATALGLVAAIPAVVIYNVFSRSIGGYRALLGDGSALVMRLLSRDCDRMSAPIARAAAE